jgi:hypothetical protein
MYISYAHQVPTHQVARLAPRLQRPPSPFVRAALQDPGLVGAGWMPPEAALAKANRVSTHSAWTCAACGLINAPVDSRCEACNARAPPAPAAGAPQQLALVRPSAASVAAAAAAPAAGDGGGAAVNGARGGSAAAAVAPAAPAAPPRAEDFPGLPGSSGRTAASAPAARAGPSAAVQAGEAAGGESPLLPGGPPARKTKKGTVITVGLGAGMGTAGRVDPRNAWTQPQSRAKLSNQWAQGGKIAKMHGAINDAWDS